MRFLRVLIAAGAVVALLAAPVSGAPASNGAFVSGSGYRLNLAQDQRRVQFNVYAQAGTDGVWGSYWFDQMPGVGSLTFSGYVTCLDVEDNQASVGGFITRVSGSTGIRVGDRFLIFGIDNSDQDPGDPDIVSQTYILPADSANVTVPRFFPFRCPNAATTAHDAFVVQGDIALGNVND